MEAWLRHNHRACPETPSAGMLPVATRDARKPWQDLRSREHQKFQQLRPLPLLPVLQ